ncbi:MAG: glycosyltransferase family 4 protein [Acidobacteria bacterium]|nr:glycosyltransferase family 4 protein [Acidobacteriota bacterium]MYJ06007.1 glycosyltransferase family 4 protein [Acidobacteriota bacterium]
MTILYLADIRFPLERANGVHSMETCAALAERGHNVHMLVRRDTVAPPRDPFAFYGVPSSPRITIERAPAPGLPAVRRAAYLARMAMRLPDRRWDAVYTPNLILAAAALRLPRSLRPPVVFESHNFSPSFAQAAAHLETGSRGASAMKLGRLTRRERRVWRRAEGYVTTTRVLAADLAGRFGDRKHVATAPNGVRLDRIPAVAAPGHREGPPVVAYAGSLHPYKGVDTVVEALAHVPQAHGLIIGGHPNDAPDRARLDELAQRHGVADRLTFTGLVPPGEVLDRLAAADVLAAPLLDMPHTRYDSPMKLFEYLALRRPIVASDLVSLQEIFEDGRTARLVAPGDAAALGAGIRSVLNDPAAAERMAQAAFREVAKYTWARRAERIEVLLDEVVAGA